MVYETDDNVREFIKSFADLAHAPVADVADAFDQLTESSPNVPHVDELITYFKHTYIRSCCQRGLGHNYGTPLLPIQSWNETNSFAEGFARTNNICFNAVIQHSGISLTVLTAT